MKVALVTGSRLLAAIAGWLGSCLTLQGAEAVRLPPSQKVTLENGLRLILVEQHEVPIISFSLIIPWGSTADPQAKEGLASITAGLLRKGTASRTADQIATELDFVGGSLVFSVDNDFTEGHGEFLKKDIAVGLDLLTDMLLHPIFPQTEFEKFVGQEVDGLKQEKDEPQAVISKYFEAFLFGSHPYGHPSEGDEVTLGKMRRDDVVSFHAERYTPVGSILAVAGDFDPREMERELRARFSQWRRAKSVSAHALSQPQRFEGRKVLLVDKPDSTQTFFWIGNIGIHASHPDRVAIEVVNTVFGGRFTSMLNDALRVSSGLTYGARSVFDRRLVAGPFAISSFTQNATTKQAIDLALDVLQRLHKEGLTAEQLASAKAYLKGQYPPRVETTDQLAAVLAQLEFLGLDKREVNEYFARIDAVTLDDARRVIREDFPKSNLVFVLIGKAEEISGAVAKYAERVERREISSPGYVERAGPGRTNRALGTATTGPDIERT